VALLWSLTVSLDKVAIARSSGPFHATVLCTGVSAGIFLVLAARRQLGELADVRRASGVIVLGIAASIVALGLQFLAVQQVWVGLLETLKRSIGNLSAVVFGRAFFGEALTLRKLLAVSLMAAGVALILA